MPAARRGRPTVEVDVADIDAVLAAARAERVDSDQVEIGLPRGEGKAWTVAEVHREYPTSVDAAAATATMSHTGAFKSTAANRDR